MAPLLAKLGSFDPLVDGTSKLAQIANDADVKFTASGFSLIASSRSEPRFIARLFISHEFFTTYSHEQDQSARVSLEQFHDAMLDGCTFSSMTIHLHQHVSEMVLRFQSPSDVTQLRCPLRTIPAQVEELGLLDHDKFFGVDSRALRFIIKELPLFREDSVSVTVTSAEVRFRIGSRVLLLPGEGDHVQITGYEEGVETKFKMVLRPILFFLNFTFDSEFILFYMTLLNSHAVMCVPTYGFDAQFIIYFPQSS